MRILLITDVIHAGGAETFVLRMAQALYERNHEVSIFSFYKNKIDYKVAEAIAPDVKVYAPSIPFLRKWQKLDSLMIKLNIDFSAVNFFLQKEVKTFLEKNKVDIIHSHLFTADWVSLKAAATTNVPVISTMHGDYALYYKKLQEQTPIRILNYLNKLAWVSGKLNEIVCISDEQLQFFTKTLKQKNLPLHKIYNGYAIAGGYRQTTKEEIGIPKGDIVLGMVARGIPEKGWEEVIEAFIGLNKEEASLILVGDSDYVQTLKQRYKHKNKVFFVGYSSNPIEYIKLFDIGLFASTYFAESLPTVIIEYLSCQVPVITVAIAECQNMVSTSDGTAGVVVPLKNEKVDVQSFKAAMVSIINNPEFYYETKACTTAAFKKFEMQYCIKQYETLYEKHKA